MDLTTITEIIQKLGYKGILIAPILFIFYSFIQSKFFQDLMGRFINFIIDKFIKDVPKDNVRNITESDILNHDIFNYIDYWKYSVVPTISFSTDYRTAVFKEYLNIYLTTYKKTILEYVTSKKYETITGVVCARLSI